MIFQSQSWTPGLRNHHTITDLFNKSSLAPIMRNALGGEPDVIPEAQGGQIALRFPLPPEEADAVAQQPEALRWGGHLDGLHTPTNGVPKGVLGTFTCLVGVALSEQLEPFCGNLGVLRGGHKINEQFFRRQLASGDGSFGPGGEGWPLTDDGVPSDYIPPPLREALADAPGSVRGDDGRVSPLPTQVMCKPGDAVLVHYCVPHGNVRECSSSLCIFFGSQSFCTANLSPDTRYMIYFRVNHKDHGKFGGNGEGKILVDNWFEWPGVADALDADAARL